MFHDVMASDFTSLCVRCLCALRVLDEFWNYRKNCTDGCETRSDILFLLTDGAPTDVVCPDMNERANTTTVDIVIIGIGTNAEASNNWMSQIECLDVADNYEDIYYVEEFETGVFNSIEAVIRNYTCSGKFPAISPSTAGPTSSPSISP